MGLVEFDPPDRFVAGTVGPPGQRTFFLQASEGRRLTSVSLEKQQVSVLADRINDLLDSYAGGEGADHAAAEVVDNAPLDTPIEDEFRVTTLSLAWDDGRQVVVIEASTATPTTRRPGSTRRSSPRSRGRCGSSSPRPGRARSPGGPSPSCPPVDRPARSAADRSNPRGTSAPARTATSADPARRWPVGLPRPPDARRPGGARGAGRRLQPRAAGAARATTRDRWRSTSRSAANGRSGTSRTGRWPPARSPPT